MELEFIYVFNAQFSTFPGGLFRSKKMAEDWIFKHGLEGTLTKYPIDVGCYDWAIEAGLFTPKKPHQSEAKFIGGFSSASQEHYHYEIENGEYI